MLQSSTTNDKGYVIQYSFTRFGFLVCTLAAWGGSVPVYGLVETPDGYALENLKDADHARGCLKLYGMLRLHVALATT